MFKETLSFTISVVQIRTRHPHIHHPQWRHPNVLERKRVTSGELSLGPGSGGVLRVPATPNCARAPPALLRAAPAALSSRLALPRRYTDPRRLSAVSREGANPPAPAPRPPSQPGSRPSRSSCVLRRRSALAPLRSRRCPPARPPSPAFVAASAPGQVGAFPCSLHVSGSSSSLSPCSPGGSTSLSFL